MNKAKLSVITLLALANAPAIALAYEQNSSAWENKTMEDFYIDEWKYSLRAGSFYAIAKDDILDGAGEKINVGGINFRVSERSDSFFTLNNSDVPVELFADLAIGYGSYDETERNGSSWEKEEMDLLQVQLAVGANVRGQVWKDRFSERSLSLFAGFRVGIGVTRAELDWRKRTYYNYSYYSDSDTAVGFLYGVGVGGEYEFNSHHALTFGIDFIGSTAKPEIGGLELDSQKYYVFSVGYKYTF